MTGCTHRYEAAGDERTCPRPAATDREKCVFHLRPEERAAGDVTGADLRAAVVADPAGRDYVDVHLRKLDLSAPVVDGDDVDHQRVPGPDCRLRRATTADGDSGTRGHSGVCGGVPGDRGGLVAGDEVVTYASHGVAAVVDSLYFGIVTVATLGLGDVHPAGTLGRFLAAFEGV